jgi:hypothetical protein
MTKSLQDDNVKAIARQEPERQGFARLRASW